MDGDRRYTVQHLGRVHARRERGGAEERLPTQAIGLDPVAPNEPEAKQGARQPQTDGRIRAGLPAALERATDLVLIRGDSRVPAGLLPAGELRLRSRGERDEVIAMPSADLRGLITALEVLGGIGPNRLQHPKPDRPLAGLEVRNDQGLVHQSRGEVQDVPIVHRPAGRDRFRGLQRPAAGENREALQQELLRGLELLVAPVDQRAKRPVMGQVSSRSPREQAESVVHPAENLLDTQHLQA